MAFSIRIAPRGKYEKLIRDLQKAERILEGERTDAALQQLATAGKDFIVEGIKNGREAWADLNEITKRLKGKDDILVDSGSFVGAMTVWKEGRRWFGGLPNGATGDKGQDLNLVGMVHEWGATVPVSDEIRGFFAANGFPLRADTKYLTIPPRAWFAPAYAELHEYATEVVGPLVDALLEEIG
jgi:hypothetical protein